MEKEKTEPTDYEANVTERRRSYIARAAGAVTAVVTSIVSGGVMLKHSLHKYLHDRLFARDWTNGSVEHVIKGMAKGELDTISGAVTDPEKLKARSRRPEGPLTNGTLIGDPAANKALKDLYAANLRDEVKYLNEKQLQELMAKELAATSGSQPSSMFVPGFLKDAFDKFKVELHCRDKDRKRRMEALEQKSFKDPKLCRAEIDSLYENLEAVEKAHVARHEATIAEAQKSFTSTTTNFEPLKQQLDVLEKERLAARASLLEAFKEKKLLHIPVQKFMEEEHKIKANFTYYTDQAKKRLLDKPVYDEMIKAGNAPGHMGLKLRHAHDKKQIVIFATVAGVSAGYIAYRAVTSYLHRNDKGKDEERTFQEGVVAGREAAMHEQQSIV